MGLIGSDRVRAVVGLGKSGVSCVKFLAQKGLDFFVVDSRENPPGLDEIKAFCDEDKIFLGSLEALTKLGVTELFVSPGVALSNPVLKKLAEQGVEMRGDIDLFAEYVDAPFIAITGSNAKSTVTTLVEYLLKSIGKAAIAGGNIGRPALDTLSQEADYYVLELSSFQLETTHALKADVACMLNVSEDHMDRYDDLYSYQRAKQRIYRGCKSAVCNKQDILTAPLLSQDTPVRAFTTGSPDLKEFGLLPDDKGVWLSKGVKPLYHSSEIALKGTHNLANVLAALSILDLLGVDIELPAVAQGLYEFKGLPHRCETVAVVNGVTYINDSKGTNVGATLAALNGLGDLKRQNIILIAGGEGKDADFSPLSQPIDKYVKRTILFGKDADLISTSISDVSVYSLVGDLSEAVALAKSDAKEGDIVLLSPACASFDMYKGFEARGEHFVELVKAL
ncbi:UDP-N-acetylmuramoyl-L-alanine--D-glutamate ligase [Marinomonas mediterranea]|jgi:UDP-N-acetylmuramoylalanine--D-glutamate ligase (EC 6.3.2.9)|uniref:UDP-N-acetylmuramoylalanine--D-glutamate ligase n=1 Tax=Marinomonas mediterranea (strain ATCC 700492 / JCM 21426 / NBRC 103028 / MMB-1) TaxID=717774 RepID=F2JVX0_MARM1|nr:UDP-N-acetylmuramoyl-L-alanine--D-glutamate ligase [Marinomonas mediterranea]ADZ91756.1 UDP-N-acetylmuramoylalanine--D-glutamate ligase [Marinomonas mediterranea MMB-1]WCN17850.1 UDP-N-acetylmuramoyl-L-alanine--D-glutamate ligase [Marinomonas mediterranea MMB-1]